MPSVTYAELSTLSPGKKRSRDENGEIQAPLFAHAGANDAYTQDKLGRLPFHDFNHKRPAPNSAEPFQRKIRPLPSSKRVRVSDEGNDLGDGLDHETQRNHAPNDYSTPPMSPQLRPVLKHASKSFTIGQLTPCHICRRKPTKKSDLDAYADCEGCGQRTCYVCIRECQGWLPNAGHAHVRQEMEEEQQPEDALSRSFTMHDVDDDAEPHMALTRQLANAKNNIENSRYEVGWDSKTHASVICSRCCVERGSEGDVMCLGCLAGVEGA